MANPTLEQQISAYLAQPVTGERLPTSLNLSIGLVGLLQTLAQERGVSVDVIVEYALFKAMRAENARLMVGERPDPIPSSFMNDKVAQAKVELGKDKAAMVAGREERGDKASRLADQMEAELHAAKAPDEQLDAVRRKGAEAEAMLDQALKKRS